MYITLSFVNNALHLLTATSPSLFSESVDLSLVSACPVASIGKVGLVSGSGTRPLSVRPLLCSAGDERFRQTRAKTGAGRRLLAPIVGKSHPLFSPLISSSLIISPLSSSIILSPPFSSSHLLSLPIFSPLISSSLIISPLSSSLLFSYPITSFLLFSPPITSYLLSTYLLFSYHITSLLFSPLLLSYHLLSPLLTSYHFLSSLHLSHLLLSYHLSPLLLSYHHLSPLLTSYLLTTYLLFLLFSPPIFSPLISSFSSHLSLFFSPTLSLPLPLPSTSLLTGPGGLVGFSGAPVLSNAQLINQSNCAVASNLLNTSGVVSLLGCTGEGRSRTPNAIVISQVEGTALPKLNAKHPVNPRNSFIVFLEMYANKLYTKLN